MIRCEELRWHWNQVVHEGHRMMLGLAFYAGVLAASLYTAWYSLALLFS